MANSYTTTPYLGTGHLCPCRHLCPNHLCPDHHLRAKRGANCVVFIAERTGERQRPRLEQWEYAWLNGNVHVQRRICAHWRGIARVRKQWVERRCADVHCGSMRGVGTD